MFDPSLGRWITLDPLGLGIDSNPYRYVRNNPTGLTDPSGLAPPSDWGSGILAALFENHLESTISLLQWHLQFYNNAIKPELINAMKKVQSGLAAIGIKGCISAQLVNIRKLKVEDFSLSHKVIVPGTGTIEEIIRYGTSDEGLATSLNAYMIKFKKFWNSAENTPTEVISNCSGGRSCGDKWDCKEETIKINKLTINRKLTDIMLSDSVPKALKDVEVSLTLSLSFDVKICTAKCGCGPDELGAVVGGMAGIHKKN